MNASSCGNGDAVDEEPPNSSVVVVLFPVPVPNCCSCCPFCRALSFLLLLLSPQRETSPDEVVATAAAELRNG
jgi:hypothetical protein